MRWLSWITACKNFDDGDGDLFEIHIPKIMQFLVLTVAALWVQAVLLYSIRWQKNDRNYGNSFGDKLPNQGRDV